MVLSSQPLNSINSSQTASSTLQPATSTGKVCTDGFIKKRTANTTKKKSSSKSRGQEQDGQIAGNILEVDEANSSAFNRDLNNLTVYHDPCQYVSYDPFLNPDDFSRPRIFRTNDPGVNLQNSRALENERNQRLKTSRLSGFFLLFILLSRGHRIWKENFSDVVFLCKLFNSCCIFPLHPGL